MLRSFQLALVLTFLASHSYSQTDSPAVLTFTLDFPASQPEHYVIRVQADGKSRYESVGRISADSDETDSFALDFIATSEMRRKIFDLAAKVGYFQKDVDSHHKGMAFTGKKTLTYKDDRHSGESTYNYSSIQGVQDLTGLMQSLSETLEFGHRLQYDRQYQKLALDEELKRMEEMAHSNQLVEVASIRPILEEITADQSVINVTRARAQRLLERVSAR
jgi:hypothetical protein